MCGHRDIEREGETVGVGRHVTRMMRGLKCPQDTVLCEPVDIPGHVLRSPPEDFVVHLWTENII